MGRQVGLRVPSPSGSLGSAAPASVVVPLFGSSLVPASRAAFPPSRRRSAGGTLPVSPASTDGLARYLVIVERQETVLCDFLRRQFAGDAQVRVFTDRRRDRRRRDAGGRGFCWIVDAHNSEDGPVTARHTPDATSRADERRRCMEGLEDRQRVDRWVEESQYLIGRMIPGLLDDRERLRGKVEAAEQECARLRQEINELRKEIGDLQGETQFFRTEHVAMAEALREVIDHVGQVQKPLTEVFRRLQVTQPALSVTPA